jgi:hypothetical protein
MKLTLTKSVLVLFALTALAAVVLAQQQSRAVLGKIDHQALLEAAPGIPATPAEAGKRAYGAEIKADRPPLVLDTFYASFYKKVEAARDVIKDAVANRQQNQEALTQRSIAQAEASPIVNRMGGVDKMSEMSEEEAKQAAAQAAGSYQQSLSGAPSNPSGGGMQAMMQRMMNDPAYQERFEKKPNCRSTWVTHRRRRRRRGKRPRNDRRNRPLKKPPRSWASRKNFLTSFNG